jgi:hypothetical protein
MVRRCKLAEDRENNYLFWTLLQAGFHFPFKHQKFHRSGGQSSWLQTQKSRVPFPALPDFLRIRGSGTGSTQPHEVNEELLELKVAAPV